MKNNLIELCRQELVGQDFGDLAVSVLDFSKGTFDFIEIYEDNSSKKYFDLASVTKPMTLAASYIIQPEIFTQEMKLLLNHRAGLFSWGRLSNSNWKEQLLSYPINQSETLYSDFSALRLMLEIEKINKRPLYDTVSIFWDKELKSWIDLLPDDLVVTTGIRNNKQISGIVHDDNAFVIKQRVSHAGLFSTIQGLSQSLLNLNNQFKFIEKTLKEFKLHDGTRFLSGWDTAQENSLAGRGCGKFTIGHLGFTGTSVWIDLERKIGLVILTNGTKKYWYAKESLNKLRRSIGTFIWSQY